MRTVSDGTRVPSPSTTRRGRQRTRTTSSTKAVSTSSRTSGAGTPTRTRKCEGGPVAAPRRGDLPPPLGARRPDGRAADGQGAPREESHRRRLPRPALGRPDRYARVERRLPRGREVARRARAVDRRGRDRGARPPQVDGGEPGREAGGRRRVAQPTARGPEQGPTGDGEGGRDDLVGSLARARQGRRRSTAPRITDGTRVPSSPDDARRTPQGRPA